MKYFLTILLFFALMAFAVSGPPEPEAPPAAPAAEELLFSGEELESLQALELSLEDILIEKQMLDDQLRLALEGVGESLQVVEISIDEDTVSITLSNGSIFVFSDLEKGHITKGGKDVLHVGGDTVVDTDEIVRGDIISALGDVTVKGTVTGSVMAFSGDIYVTSTGTIRGTAVALSGKIKQDAGGHILGGDWTLKTPIHVSEFHHNSPFRIMGFVLFLIYIIWMVLAATGASLFKKQVSMVVNTVKTKTLVSFLKGYLAYVLIVISFLVLLITILGIPLALLGIPVATLAGMILSFIAASVITGQRITHSDEPSFKTFLYGSLALGLVPGLFFFTLMLTGSLVVMIFSWIFVFLFLSVILPFGLGAVLSTRFGVRASNNQVNTSHPEN
ncbi:MAG: hypothetical protein V3W18_08555 [candidate division Zixibacteria bacterium]